MVKRASLLIRFFPIALVIITAFCLPCDRLCAQDESALSDEDQIRMELRQLFESMRDYGYSYDREEIPVEDYFDLEAMTKSIQAAAKLDDEKTSDVAQLALLAGILRQSFVSAIQAKADTWERLKLERLELSDQNRRVVLTLRTWNQLGVTYRQRFWLTKQETGWRIIDSEDLGLGIRVSRTLGKLYQDLVQEEDPQIALARVRVIEVTTLAGAGGNISIAFAVLQQLDEAALPEEVRSLTLVLSGAAALRDDSPEQALEIYDEAERLEVDIPLLQYNRAVALNRLGRSREALECAREFVDLYGDDADAQLEIGRALASLGEDDDAIEAFRVGLDDTPDMIDNLIELGLLLPIDEKEEITERFLKLSEPEIDFEEIAIGYNDAGDMDALAALVQGLMERAPNDPNAAYYGALVLFDRDRYDEAAELLIPALPRAPEDELMYYRELFLDCCLEAGRPIYGYDNVADKRSAFDYLGRALNERSEYELVQTLINRHATADPLDPKRWYIEGDMYFFQDQFAKADESYEKVGSDVNEDLREEVRFSRVICWYYLGKGAEAVTKFDPYDDTFDQLATMYYRDDDADGLKALSSAHEDNATDQGLLLYWNAYGHSLAREYEQAIDVAKSWLDNFAETAEGDTVSEVESIWMRNLLRQGKLDEAMTAAKRSTERDGDPYFEAVVHVAKDDLAQFKQVAEELFDNGYHPETLLKDEDIKPLLEDEKRKVFSDWLTQKVNEFDIN